MKYVILINDIIINFFLFFSFWSVVYKISPPRRKLTIELAGYYMKEWGMIRFRSHQQQLVLWNLQQKLRPKLEAFRAVLVTVLIPQLQPFLHGSNSTKMRIKELPSMITRSVSSHYHYQTYMLKINIG